MPSLDDLFQSTEASAPGGSVIALDTPLPRFTRGLYVGVAGNVSVVMADESELTFFGVQGGTLLPIRIKRVVTAGTTATNMLALY